MPSQERLLTLNPIRLKEQIEQMHGTTQKILRTSMVIVFPSKQALPCYWHTGMDDRSDNVLECRESFLPGSKARGHNSQQEAAYGPDSVGKYDPILHKWILEPDQEKWAARERAHANQVRLEQPDLHFVKPAIAALSSPSTTTSISFITLCSPVFVDMSEAALLPASRIWRQPLAESAPGLVAQLQSMGL